MADDLTIDWDDDAKGWRAEGDPSGPAGLASVELPDGVEIDVDVAQPTRIVDVWVPDVAEAAQAERIVAIATADRVSLARLALAEDVLDGLHSSDLVLALARVDRALASGAFEQLIGARELASRISDAVDAVHASADDLFEVRRPDVVSQSLRDLQDQLGPDAALDALVGALHDAGRARREAADLDLGPVAAAMPAMPTLQESSHRAPAGRLLDVVDLDALPVGLEPTKVEARATTTSEIEVRVGAPVPTKPWWVRVHRHDGIVAVAPILPDGPNGGLARLLVPPDDLDRVEIDIVVRADEHRPSLAARAIGRAVRKGRDAARAERGDRYADAEQEWGDCATRWEEAGDPTRMRAAVERSQNSFPQGTAQNPAGGPLLSDLVDE
jgi:hypothetical protein